jgi:hypothetical protein
VRFCSQNSRGWHWATISTIGLNSQSFLVESPQPRQRLAIARALGQDLLPQPPQLGRITALGGQGRQVSPGEVAVNARVDASNTGAGAPA